MAGVEYRCDLQNEVQKNGGYGELCPGHTLNNEENITIDVRLSYRPFDSFFRIAPW